MSDKRWTASQGSAPGADPFGELCRKVLLLVAEDRLALSNYRPLIGFLKEIALGVVVATRSSGRLAEIEELGVRVIDFDHQSAVAQPGARGRRRHGRSAACSRRRTPTSCIWWGWSP